MPDEQYPPPNQSPLNPPPPAQAPPPGYSPPPAWPPPPSGYYAPPGGYYPPQAPPVNAALILVFGILGIVLAVTCSIGGIFGVIAWVMGNSALQTLENVGDPLSQRGTVQAGRICGIVGTGLMALVIVGFIALMALGFYSEKHP